MATTWMPERKEPSFTCGHTSQDGVFHLEISKFLSLMLHSFLPALRVYAAHARDGEIID